MKPDYGRITRFIGLKVIEIVVVFLILFVGHSVGDYLTPLCEGDETPANALCVETEDGSFWEIARDTLFGLLIMIAISIILFFIVGYILIPIIKQNWEWAK